jgi:PAS domain S-box-containing protein
MSVKTHTPSITRPIPTDIQIKVDAKRMIVSKTDVKGKIIYGNEYFCELAGYKESELISSPHNIIRHPDMPKAIFHLMWQHLKSGRNITAVVKNMSRNGNYYWVITDFDIKRDNHGYIQHYIAFRQAAPTHVIVEMEKLYKKLLEIEESHDMEASTAYLNAFLEEKRVNYDQFITSLAKPKGLSAILFEKMKKLFS